MSKSFSLESARRVLSRLRALCIAAALATLAVAQPAIAGDPVRIGLTPVFLDDQTAFLQSWKDYLERELGRPVHFVRRASYAEVIDLMRQQKLDFAWLCGFPFVTHRGDMDVLAVPVYNGRPLYQSYLIVPAGDNRTTDIRGLKDRVFAYSDPNSNSGYLVPQYLLVTQGEPAQFFRRTFFTGSHRAVIEAVASRLADGGAVDGYVYDALARLRPEVVERTRIVERSRPFGFPPFVVRKDVSPQLAAAFRRVLLEMPQKPDGKALLDVLFLDGFVAGSAAQFDDIAAMVATLKKAGRVP
jgi:phosphonate transport system substrate-binding protein